MNNNTNGSHRRYNPRGKRQGESRSREQSEPGYREQYEPRYREQQEPRHAEQEISPAAEHAVPSGGRVRTPLTKEAKRTILMCIVGVIGLVLILVTVNSMSSVIIGGKSYSKDAEVIDLKETGITDIQALYELTDPQCVDVRGNDIPAEQIMDFIEKYPNCQTLWSVRVGDQLASCDERSISVSGLKAEDVYLLKYFDHLESVDARGVDYEVVDAICSLGLDCDIQWDVYFGGQLCPPDTTELVTGAASDSEIRSLAFLKNLKKVDARECTAYDALVYLKEKLPECQIDWSVDIYGMKVSSTDELLDFKRMKIDDVARLDADFKNLKYLPALTKIDMCGCGVENEKMAEWRDTYTDKKFVWEVSFGNERKSWTVRTDIEAFSSLLSTDGGDFHLGNQDIYEELFLYCLDLKALDLGHNRITDISKITNLKKLQAVVLMDNPITDFSYLAELPELRYLEINKTKFTDLSFVRSCKKLEHIDISYGEVSDLTPLYDCESLKYLIIYRSKVDEEGVRAFEAINPDCVISWQGGYQYQILRCSPLRSGYRYVLKNYMYLDTFTDWETFTFVDGAKLSDPVGHRTPTFYESGRYEAAYERFKALGEY